MYLAFRLSILLTCIIAIGASIIEIHPPVDAIGSPSIHNTLAPLENVSSISGGASHVCALTLSAIVKCWGENTYGELGDSSNTSRNFARGVTELTISIESITTGDHHSCALKTGGQVYCWGHNEEGQLGDGTTTHRNIPVAVSGWIDGVTYLKAGHYHTCGIRISVFYCWGDNAYGQLGNGTKNDRYSPTPVTGLTNVTAVAAGFGHTCALNSGQVYCWGLNTSGQLGDGTTTEQTAPKMVPVLSNITQIVAGAAHTCALTNIGIVYCWGKNSNGQLGDGSKTNRLSPTQVNGLGTVDLLSSWGNHTCAKNDNSVVYCWGLNDTWQLGDGSNTERATPVITDNATNPAALITGYGYTCAVGTDVKQVSCWGFNGFGQLGNGTNNTSSSPVTVVEEEPATPTPIPTATRTNTSTATPLITPTFTTTPIPTPSSTPTSSYTTTWAVMVYLNGDNDLDAWTEQLFNRLELAGARESNQSLQIQVLWDRQKNGDTVLYSVQPNTDLNVLASYEEGQTKWSKNELDMGDRNTLLNFVKETRQAIPAKYYLLSIVDHGGGWSPKLLVDQKPSSRYAAGASGFVWDWTNDHHYLSTSDMGYIFSQPELTNQPIDIVFYDACLMSMAEEAYEIRKGARFLIASQSETWTSFPYTEYLTDIATRTPKEQAIWMVDTYYASLARYPRTMSALDLQYAESLGIAISNLAVALKTNLPTFKQSILNVFLDTQKLDYDYDLQIHKEEGYIDLGNFAAMLFENMPHTDIGNAAQSLLEILDGSRGPFVMRHRRQSGFMNLDKVTGLSIYLPLGEPDRDLCFYRSDQLALAQDTQWDDFVITMAFCPEPPGSVGGRGNKPQPLTTGVYLPIIAKS